MNAEIEKTSVNIIKLALSTFGLTKPINSSNVNTNISHTNQTIESQETNIKSSSTIDNNNNLPEISLCEVSYHDNSTDCWIILYDRIYDVTNFLSSHPGGYEVILEYAGRDATFAFRGTGHSKYAIRSLKKYEIGILPMPERIFRCIGKLTITDLPV